MMMQDALWNWGSPIWVVAVAIAAAYLWKLQLGVRQIVSLSSALGLLIIAYVSPIGVLANGYLFSAHMLQHLLLLLVIPLCLLLSLPTDRGRVNHDPHCKDTSQASMGSARRYRPALCWAAGVGAMWFWHVPTFCSAATQNALLGAVRDVSFVIAGLLFWWPIYGNRSGSRLPALAGVTYLFSACFACTLLGIYITFTPLAVCPVFANPVDRIGIMNQLYHVGMTPSVDQNLGGLLMWVPPCSLYVGAIISLLCRWYAELPPAPISAPERVQPGPT